MKNFLKLFLTIGGALLAVYALVFGAWAIASMLPPISAWLTVPVALILIAAIVAGIATVIDKIAD